MPNINGIFERPILAVPASAVDFGGFFADDGGKLRTILASAVTVDRGPAESDPSFKQVIPYVAIRKGGLVFSYARGKSGGEGRLHALRSIGVGGHVDGYGLDISDVTSAASRECLEEVGISGPCRIVGLINDDSNDVGKVHLGVAMILDVDEDVSPKEDCLVDAKMSPIGDVNPSSLETWSRILIDSRVLSNLR